MTTKTWLVALGLIAAVSATSGWIPTVSAQEGDVVGDLEGSILGPEDGYPAGDLKELGPPSGGYPAGDGPIPGASTGGSEGQAPPDENDGAMDE